MDLLEIAQRVADNLDDMGILLAEAAAVLQLHQQPTAAMAADLRGLAQQVAHDLAQTRNRLVGVESNALAASVTLAKAAALLREDIDATKILVEEAFKVVPAHDDLDPDGRHPRSRSGRHRVLRGAGAPRGDPRGHGPRRQRRALPPPVIGTLRNAQRSASSVWWAATMTKPPGTRHPRARRDVADLEHPQASSCFRGGSHGGEVAELRHLGRPANTASTRSFRP
uniref:Uncharacterized protein n=1 Tax=Oryza barthii TaxID=65489 RepID=A0A0D3FIV2_9ORYZ